MREVAGLLSDGIRRLTFYTALRRLVSEICRLSVSEKNIDRADASVA